MQEARPYLVTGPDAAGTQLRPVSTKDKILQEQWLQELLYRYPSILPISSIDDAFAPTIAIGREIAGIDNLFISPAGLLTIVETKLWRNPEAHRTVVAQILDYARTLSAWSYQQLDKAVQADWAKRHGERRSLYQIVEEHSGRLDVNSVEFQELVQGGLENGRFALLIVGDKIYPRATQLAEMIQSAPHLQYTLGFVELQCYRLQTDKDWPLIVFPHVVARTKEVTRAVVKVLYEKKRPEVQVVTPPEEPTSRGFTSFPEFTASLPSSVSELFKTYIEGWMRGGFTVRWGTVGFTLRVTWKGQLGTVMEAYPTYASIFQDKRLRKFDVPEDLHRAYKAALMESRVISAAFAAGRRYLTYERMSDDDIALLLHATDAFARAIQSAQTSQQ